MRSLIRLAFVASHLVYYSTMTSLDLQSNMHITIGNRIGFVGSVMRSCQVAQWLLPVFKLAT